MSNDRDSQRAPNRDAGFIQIPAEDWLELPESPKSSSESSSLKSKVAKVATITLDSKPPENGQQIISSKSQKWLKGDSELDAQMDHPGQYYRGQYAPIRSRTPWWIILMGWLVLGLPALGFSIHQLSRLLTPAQDQTISPDGGMVAQDSALLPITLVVVTATFLLFYILGRQTARRIRSDRRQQRFRYRLKNQNS